MSKITVADATAQIYKIIEGFSEADDKARIMDAVRTLLGQPSRDSDRGREGDDFQAKVDPKKMTAKQYFDEKKPNSKVEELALAARYRELHENKDVHEKEDFKAVVSAARRNFDSGNYNRDLNNAKRTGLFNKGEGNVLAYYGQNYVDALPDRDAVKLIKKPKGAIRKSKSKKPTKA